MKLQFICEDVVDNKLQFVLLITQNIFYLLKHSNFACKICRQWWQQNQVELLCINIAGLYIKQYKLLLCLTSHILWF